MRRRRRSMIRNSWLGTAKSGPVGRTVIAQLADSSSARDAGSRSEKSNPNARFSTAAPASTLPAFARGLRAPTVSLRCMRGCGAIEQGRRRGRLKSLQAQPCSRALCLPGAWRHGRCLPEHRAQQVRQRLRVALLERPDGVRPRRPVRRVRTCGS